MLFGVSLWKSCIFATETNKVILVQNTDIQMETTVHTPKDIRKMFDNTMSMRKRWTDAVRKNATRAEMEKMGIKQIAIIN